MFALYRLTPTGPQALPWPPAATSLDAATRALPEGFYTTFRTYDHKRRVLGLRRHLRRLYAPLPTPPPLAPAALRATLRQALFNSVSGHDTYRRIVLSCLKPGILLAILCSYLKALFRIGGKKSG